MRVIPVVDVLNGVVVRGVGGRRDEYRPLISGLVDSCDPYEVATALYETYGCPEVYLADLDAIIHRRPNWDLYRRLPEIGFSLWIDAGIRSADEARQLANLSHVTVIAGLETIASPRMLAEVTVSVDTSRLAFSLDLHQGRSLGSPDWPKAPEGIVAEVAALGIDRLIVLDLADVGTSTGGSTDRLCSLVREIYPELQIIAGGGIRGPHDLQRMRQSGINGVLVASALHDKSLSREDVQRPTAS